MPSSTSSSSQAVPRGSWGKTWLLAVGLALAFAGGAELFWRNRGVVPSVLDDKLLWAQERDDVYATDDRTPVAVLGASRVQLGFVPEVFEQDCPGYRVIQLAIDGTAPVATLADLARDDRFVGIVLCSVNARGLAAASHGTQQDHVDYGHELLDRQWAGDEMVNRRIATFLQERFAVLSPDVRAIQIVKAFLKRRVPGPNYLVTMPDRSRLADYTKLDIVRHRANRIARSLGGLRPYLKERKCPKEWLEEAMRTESMVRAIEARGGKVVFIRYVTTGELLAMEERAFPKAEYWDRFAEASSAETVHFADVASLRDYECPDTSHLDRKDARRYTRALAEELRRRGIIR